MAWGALCVIKSKQLRQKSASVKKKPTETDFPIK